MTKMMAVEDDSIIRRELSTLLALAGYDVAAAKRFDDVAAQIARENPALVLLDINLPGDLVHRTAHPAGGELGPPAAATAQRLPRANKTHSDVGYINQRVV